MPRADIAQIQIGDKIYNFRVVEFDPTFDLKDIRARIIVEDIGGGVFRPVLLFYSSDVWSIDTYGRFSSYFWELRARGASTDYLAAGCVVGSTGCTFYLNYWDGDSWEDSLYYDSGSPPYLRLTHCALILGADKIAADANIQTDQLCLSWNQTTQRLEGKDSTPTTYNFGYTDRGDPSAVDWAETGLTLDGTWRDLSLSSIVPAGTKSVVLSVRVKDAAVGTQISFRKNGLSNAIAISKCITQVADQEIYYDITVSVASQTIEYNGDAAMDEVDIVVKGWFI